MPSADAGELRIERGTCFAFYAYDLGHAIDLVAAERRILAAKQRETIRHRRRAPESFAFRPEPLNVSEAADPIAVGGFRTEPRVDCLLYDFGAVSITYSIPIAGPFDALRDLSHSLYENPVLLDDARKRVERMLASLGDAVTKPGVAPMVEDYAIYQIDSLAPAHSAPTLCSRIGPTVAQILRSESQPLSDEEVADATAARIAFGPDDVTILDWNAAMVFDDNADDVLAVIEFANVQLLEMRFLDAQLDRSLEQSYERSSRLGAPAAGDLRHISQLQLESALLFERVTNSLKLLGDQYLARVYRLLSQRFHLREWDATISRKLATLDGLYEKLTDRSNSRRLEVLEWIVIVLIALELVVPFIPGAFTGRH